MVEGPAGGAPSAQGAKQESSAAVVAQEPPTTEGEVRGGAGAHSPMAWLRSFLAERASSAPTFGARPSGGAAAPTSAPSPTNAPPETQTEAALRACDRHLEDADRFQMELAAFEQQLAEEKARARTFVASLLPAGASEGDEAQLHASAQYVATESQAMSSQLDARAASYTDRLAIASTYPNDPRGPTKKTSRRILGDFEQSALATRIDMGALGGRSLDPSASSRIADQIIASAKQLKHAYAHSARALDELFTKASREIDRRLDPSPPIRTPSASNQVAVASAAVRPMPTPDRVPAAVSSALARAEGAPLPAPEQWSRRVGADVSHARIVTGEGAPEAAESIHALAFTVAHRVFFARGNDEKTDGGNLLAHELTHVAQQRGAPAPGSWDQTPFVDYHDAREVAARAHDGATPSGSSEQAIARDAEPDLNNDQYLAKFSTQIGEGVIQYLAAHDLPSGSRFVVFPTPLVPGPAIVGAQGSDLAAKLAGWIGREKLWRAIDTNRPKGTEQVTDGDKTWVEEKGHDGPGRWFPDIAIQLGAALHAALRVSLDRIVPRYQSAAVAIGIAAEDKAKQNLVAVPRPRAGDVVASSPLDVQTIGALVQYATFDYATYRTTYPQEKGKLGELRAVELKIEAPKDGVFYARVKTPADATKEEVANQIFGSSTASGELQIVAPPLFGFADGGKLKSQYADPLKAAGVKLEVSVFDPVAAAAKGPMAEELAKNQGLQQPSKLATKTGVLAALDENVAIIATIEKSGAAFGMGKNPTVASLAPLVKELNDRRTKIAAMPEEDALSWAGQVEGQQAILSQVSFSFARHAQRLADLTKMVTDPKIKLGGFNLPPYVREAMNGVAMRYADVCTMSAMPVSAAVKLAEVEELAGALPVTFLEGTLASIQGTLDAARDAKHDAGEHASYDVGGMQNREVELKRRLVALREQIKTDPEGATRELASLSKLVSELQTETELVANMDRIDAAWQALDKGISFWWTGVITQYKASHLKDDGDRLHARWKALFTQWKSGDPQQQELAKQGLDKLRNDGELTAWLGKIQGVLKDAQIEKLIGEFVVVIAITVVTAGVGDLVVAARRLGAQRGDHGGARRRRGGRDVHVAEPDLPR